MRQVVALLEKIKIRNTTNEYYRSALLAKLHGAEITPLDQILGVASSEPTFDDATEKEFDDRALKILAERRALANVGR